MYSTTGPVGDGDGWAGYLYVYPYPAAGGYYDIEVKFSIPGQDQLRDTLTTFIDPTPPIPEFVSFARDSIGYFTEGAIFHIPFKVPDEGPVTGKIRALLLRKDMNRTLAPVDQHGLGLGAGVNEAACVPSSIASCLTYFADNGYEELEHEDGDEENPEQSADDTAEELAGDMGTDNTGTSEGAAIGGTQKYLKRHGCDDWEVEKVEVDDYADLAGMMEEFEADSEDVIILLEDTETVAPDSTVTTGHAVTMGSKHSEYYEVQHAGGHWGCVSHKVDFMDPDGGVPQEYEIGEDENGQPETEGYNLDGDGNAKIVGYIKISPPEEGGGPQQHVALSAPFSRRSVKPQLRAPAVEYGQWTVVDEGPVAGNGVVDSLTWDTTDFPGGLYLLEVSTVDPQGNSGRDIRLAGIPEYTVGIDENEMPRPRTGFKGSYPNPFNPATTIQFTLAQKTHVSLLIYDLSGCLVKRLLANEIKNAGDHKVTWDGRNDRGKRVASGVYFCMLEKIDRKYALKMILLK